MESKHSRASSRIGWLCVVGACLALLSAACASDDGGADDGSAEARCVPGEQRACECGEQDGIERCSAEREFEACECTQPADGLAADIRIREIAIFQVVKIPLAVDGELVLDRNAPVVQGKDVLWRVYIEPQPEFEPRELRVELELSSADGSVESLTQVQMIEGPSSESDLKSTVNFELKAAQVVADLRYAVSVREVEGEADGKVDLDARFPREQDASAELGARSSGPIRVMLVPFRYQFDGSGRLPAISGPKAEAEVDQYRRGLEALYPVTHAEIEVHEPVDYPDELGPVIGWEAFLATLCALRVAERPDPNMLYYGTMAPKEGWGDYGGGTVGIANIPLASGDAGRCAVGVGFPIGYSTFIHELGHVLGRPHAPCGTPGGAFPYEMGKIGVWGYGASSRQLKDPEQTYDMMSYCSPAHISDYNYANLFERNRFMNEQALEILGAPQRFAQLLLKRDGGMQWRKSIDFMSAPAGNEHAQEARFIDARGRSMGSAMAFFFGYSEEPAGTFFIPEPPRGAVAVQVGSLHVELP